jgi:capsular polysaccharide biosynthesis protein
LIYTIKKKLQFLFKKFTYGLFKIIYSEIKGFETTETNINTKTLKSQIGKNFKYNVFLINKSRIYTDTINDTAIIQKNKIIEGPSFQIRNFKFDNVRENIVFTKGTPRLKKKIKGTVLSLLTGGAGNENYWHWLFDVLPRIKIVQNVININKIDYFLFPNVRKKFQKETLGLINIPNNKVLYSTKHRHIECDQIIATEHPYVINNDASNEIQNLPTWIIEWLKEAFTVGLDLKDNNFPEKIYIDRNDASPNIKKFRKIINEETIIKETKNAGYKNIILSNFSLLDQMKYFFNAKKIIGLHGAGFANLVFGSPGSKILELKPSNAGDVIKNLAEKCKLDYACISVVPEKFNLNNQLGHIRIDLKEFKKYL